MAPVIKCLDYCFALGMPEARLSHGYITWQMFSPSRGSFVYEKFVTFYKIAYA